MAYRPSDNLIEGVLNNTVPRKVTGWMLFYRQDKDPLRVTFDLRGDFDEDIRGKRMMIHNPNPEDECEWLGIDGTYMEGFSETQTGIVRQIAFEIGEEGISTMYINWFSRENGRVVIELDHSQVEIIDGRGHLRIVPN